jgi:MFS family permease
MFKPSHPQYKWFVLLIGVIAQVTFATAFAGIPVTAIYMRDVYHLSISDLGFILGCMGLGVAVSEIMWGILTDRLGDKIVLLIGLFLFGSNFFIMAEWITPTTSYIPSYFTLGISLVLAGVFGGSINSSSGRAVMSNFTAENRGLAMSIRQTAIPIGAAIGCIILPLLARDYGFKVTFNFVCIFSFVTFFIVLLSLSSAGEKIHAHIKSDVRSPMFKLMSWRICIVAVVLTLSQMSILTFASIFLHDYKHLNIYLISTIIIVVQFAGAALRIITGHISDRFKNRRQQIRWIAVIAGTAAILLGLGISLNTFIVVLLLMIMGVAGNSWHGLAYTDIAVMAGVEKAGTALGMIGASVFASSFITPIIISHILESSNWAVVWVVIGLLTLIALIATPKE